MTRFKQRLANFFFTPSLPYPIAFLRIAICAVLLLQAAQLAPEFFDLYGEMGILQGDLAEYYSRNQLFPAATLLKYWHPLGFSGNSLLLVLGTAYVLTLVSFLIGWQTRISAFLAWALHTVLVASHNTGYGLDTYAHIFLFYLMIFPSGGVLSVDQKLSKAKALPSWYSTFGLRVMQLHMGIAYLASAIEKGTGVQWWNGEAIWRSLTLPLYAQFDMTFISSMPVLAVVIGWGTLVLEGGYIFFMFLDSTRPIWLALILSMHIGIMLFLGLHFFGLLMALINLSLFAPIRLQTFKKRDLLAR